MQGAMIFVMNSMNVSAKKQPSQEKWRRFQEKGAYQQPQEDDLPIQIEVQTEVQIVTQDQNLDQSKSDQIRDQIREKIREKIREAMVGEAMVVEVRAKIREFGKMQSK